jgi:uncharacterized protein YeaC (DUF1315 family)
MKSDEKRSHRLNQLLQWTLRHNANQNEMFAYVKRMGVTDQTAKDYVRTVVAQLIKNRKS